MPGPPAIIVNLIKFHQISNREFHDNNIQIHINGNDHNSFHYQNTAYYKINQGHNTYVQKALLESHFGEKYIPLLSDPRFKSHIQSQRPMAYHGNNNYTTQTLPGQFQPSASKTNDHGGFIWGKPNALDKQFTTI